MPQASDKLPTAFSAINRSNTENVRAAARAGGAVSIATFNGFCPLSFQPQCATIAGVSDQTTSWEKNGIRIVHSHELDMNTPQTMGMSRAAAITHARTGASKLWAGTVVVEPNAKTGAHHHGDLETVLYIVKGRARMRWGDQLQFVDEAGPGDFIYVPPFVPHQEINARPNEPVEAVIVRSGQDPVVVNLDIPSPEDASEVRWIDPTHR